MKIRVNILKLKKLKETKTNNPENTKLLEQLQTRIEK